MRQIPRLSLLALTFLASAFAQPKIGGIVNVASYASATVGNNVIAQGSIFVVFGTGMGPATIAYASSPLPTSFPDANGTSIAISSGGQVLNAYIVYTLDRQVAAILPSGTPVGEASVTLSYNGQTSAAAKITVVKSRLGVFTANSQGTGPAAAQHGTDSSPILLTAAAQPGEVIVIYGTGLGAISGPDNVAPGGVQVGSNVTVNIAGKVVTPDYAGRSPSFAGLDQINFKIPADVATGCYIPAEVTASGQPSNLFYLSIGSGSSTCAHPLGLSADALARLDAGGTINTGLFLMLRAVVQGLGAEGAGGLFETADANAVFQLFSRILVAFGGYNYPVASGSCAILDTVDPVGGFAVPDFATLGGKELQAGPALSLAGTNGKSAVIPRQIPDTGGYLNVFFTTLGKGTWTLSGTGGADVGAFASNTDLPDDLMWTNNGNLSNPPREELTIAWTGGATTAQSVVTILGASVVVNPADPSKSRGKQFYCNAPATAGRFVVPKEIVLQLPSSNANPGEVAFATLGIFSGGGSVFTAPLTSGAKFDGAFLSYGEAHTIGVKFQ